MDSGAGSYREEAGARIHQMVDVWTRASAMIGVRAVPLRLELRRCQLGNYMRTFRLNGTIGTAARTIAAVARAGCAAPACDAMTAVCMAARTLRAKADGS